MHNRPALRLGIREWTISTKIFHLFLLFSFLLISRTIYVSLFVEDLPFWDQWDGEADRLLRPWTEGRLHLDALFAPHNEHRILFSRLLTLIIFKLNNNQWDNLVETYVNAALFGAMWTMLCAWLHKKDISKKFQIVTFTVIFIIAIQPYGWENMVAGFQSQFFFMAIAAIGMVAMAAFRPMSRSTWLWLCLAGAMSLFTMASGVLACISAAVVTLLRERKDSSSKKYTLAVIMSMAVLTAIGLALVPHLPYHDALKSVGFHEHFSSLLTGLMWPMQPFDSQHWSIRHCLAIAILIWMPTTIWAIRFLKHKQVSSAELFAAGIALWVVLQTAAIAHSRGHDMTALASRYMDISAIGLAVNAWFAIALFRQQGGAFIRVGARAIAILFFLAAIYGLETRVRSDWEQMSERHRLTLIQTINVHNYVRTGDFSHLTQPFLHIPYPDPNRLKTLLDTQTISAMLPPSVRNPLPINGGILEGFRIGGIPNEPYDPPEPVIGSFAHGGGDSAILRYKGPIVSTRFPYILMWTTAGSRDTNNQELLVKREGSKSDTTVSLTHSAYPRWRLRHVAVASSTFELIANQSGGDSWFAFSAPVESGRLGMYAHSIQLWVRNTLKLKTSQPAPSFRSLGLTVDSIKTTTGEAEGLASCALDLVNGTLIANSVSAQLHASIAMRGWVTNSVHQSPTTFELVLANELNAYGIEASTGTYRPDVANALRAQGALQAGFDFQAESTSVPPGSYRVIMRLQNGKTSEICDTQKSIVIDMQNK